MNTSGQVFTQISQPMQASFLMIILMIVNSCTAYWDRGNWSIGILEMMGNVSFKTHYSSTLYPVTHYSTSLFRMAYVVSSALFFSFILSRIRER